MPVRRRLRTRVALPLAGAILGLGVVVAGAPSAMAAANHPTKPLSASGIAHWHEVGSYDEDTVNAGEGVASVAQPGQPRQMIYRGILTVPASQAAQGWKHIGDPDSADGYVIDAYQGPSSRPSKMFLATSPSGATAEFVHRLVPGEMYNNSFDAISPNRQWMVSGEWETMSHLQIYPTPVLNHRTSASGGGLRLAGYIKLDHKVNDIQGCDFVSAKTLICASDDDSKMRFTNEKPLLEVTLSSALRGGSVTGHVTDLGAIPQQSTCSGTFEAEGVDYDVATGVLRVEVIQPGSCIAHTTIYEYTATRS